MILIVNIIKVIVVGITITYGFKTMKEINTDYQNYFGLGIILLLSALLSLFNDEWIRTVNAFMWCIAIYFFLQILKEKKSKL